MSDTREVVVPAWFRIMAVLALIWNLIGVYFYLVHVDAIAGPAMSEADEALASSMPAWVTAAFAIGVFAGAFGCLGLVVLKRWATPLLWLSLIALIVEHGWYLLISGAPATLGSSSIPLPVTILVVAALLVWLAYAGVRRGWLS